MMGHQPYCDHRHTAGQECNTARRIGAAAEWPPHNAPAELAAPSPRPLLEQPDVVPIGMQREAIAASEMAPARGYIPHEWRETAAAIESPRYAGPEHQPREAAPRHARPPRKRAVVIAMSVLVAAGLAVCFLHDADIMGNE